MDFYQLCTCGPQDYVCLKERVDYCARAGRSYEFAGCRMPWGCAPREAAVGFWWDGAGYLLYFTPPVLYQGEDPALAGFFAGGRFWHFSDFRSLAERLAALAPGGEGSAGPDDLFQRLQKELSARVVGQDRAVEAVAFKLCGHIRKKEPQRPLSLMLYGPTGVGKSELGKALAPVLNCCCGRERYRLVWTELNTFAQAHSVYRLIGAPPGYAGYDDPPVLEAVRQCPYTVFMFDELDKAHPEILKVFMSILDEGRCTARREDADGERELDFRRCILLFTTNTDLSYRRRLGFAPPQTVPLPLPGGGGSDLARRLFQADEAARQALVRAGVLGEIAGRFSGFIGFQPLTARDRSAVTARQIAALGREYGLEITAVSEDILQALTPADALSLRSTAGVLEGVLTPLLVRAAPGRAFRLEGTVQSMQLLPA